jgi:hypothetical protein
LVYEFEKKKGGTLKLNIKQNTLDNIGAFTTVTKKLKLNGDGVECGGVNFLTYV